MKVMSKDFVDNDSIPHEFTCDGRNVSPHLAWENVPDGTKSFALSVTDPDGIGGWNHLLLYKIPKKVKEIEKNGKPAGALEMENDFPKNPYGEPSLHSGKHRYVFTVYALDEEQL